MNIGTKAGGGITRVGERCIFMVGSHVAHDCNVGDDVTFANNAVLGGHVGVGSGTFSSEATRRHALLRCVACFTLRTSDHVRPEVEMRCMTRISRPRRTYSICEYSVREADGDML
jgi:acyl-[acyl carrier protein]--UDP-N-acetylglucosamine O-acyltransferase